MSQEEIERKERRVLVIATADGNEGDRPCPACGEHFTDSTVVSVCSLKPEDHEDKHCFVSAGKGKIAVFVHEQLDKNDSVSIEIE